MAERMSIYNRVVTREKPLSSSAILDLAAVYVKERTAASYFSSERQRSTLAPLEFHSILPLTIFFLHLAAFHPLSAKAGGKGRNKSPRNSKRNDTNSKR